MTGSKHPLRGKCPSCGVRLQLSKMANSLRRNYTVTCANCGTELQSQLSNRSYILLIIYAHVVFVAISVPLVLALAGGKWLFAAASLLVFLLATLPVAMLLHTRNIRVREVKLTPRR